MQCKPLCQGLLLGQGGSTGRERWDWEHWEPNVCAVVLCRGQHTACPMHTLPPGSAACRADRCTCVGCFSSAGGRRWRRRSARSSGAAGPLAGERHCPAAARIARTHLQQCQSPPSHTDFSGALHRVAVRSPSAATMRAALALQPAAAPARLQRPTAAPAAQQRAPAPVAAQQRVGSSRWAAQAGLPLAAGRGGAATATAAAGRRLSLRCSSSAQPAAASTEPLDMVSEVARQNLKKAANSCRRYGWISFWVQLVLNSVAAVVLLFSLAFTSQVRQGSACCCALAGGCCWACPHALPCCQASCKAPCLPAPPPGLQNGPSISLYLTFFGILLGFLSIFWSFGACCAAETAGCSCWHGRAVSRCR